MSDGVSLINADGTGYMNAAVRDAFGFPDVKAVAGADDLRPLVKTQANGETTSW